MKEKDVPESKRRILLAAEELFSEKGFDGARVDDIAEKAGVNKALIYYYFKSKRNILEELLGNLVEELVRWGYVAAEEFMDFGSGETMRQQVEEFYEFMESKKDTLRIMLMESLKASEERPILFRFSEIAMSDEAEQIAQLFRDRGFNIDNIDMDEAMIADFFTGMIPMISFIVYHDEWSRYFSIAPEELKKKFFTVFLTTHMAYHKVQLAKMK